MTSTFDPSHADMRAANQIGRLINGYLISRDLRDLDPIRDLVDEVMAAKCADTIVATYARITGSQLTDDEAARAIDMPVDEIRTMRRITNTLGDPSPKAAADRTDTSRQMAQAA